eukprot:scaffold123396_cov30-Tisochrysis_lutea.AAC.13
MRRTWRAVQGWGAASPIALSQIARHRTRRGKRTAGRVRRAHMLWRPLPLLPCSRRATGASWHDWRRACATRAPM